MAWNDSGNGKNPWDTGGGNDGPPDLDKIIRDWQRRFNALLGGKGKRSGTGGSEGPGGAAMGGLLILIVAGWLATSSDLRIAPRGRSDGRPAGRGSEGTGPPCLLRIGV